MNTEIMILKGQLADDKKRFNDLKIKALGTQSIVRQLIPPYGDLLKIDEEKFLVYSKELFETIKEMKELHVKITEMERDLNG